MQRNLKSAILLFILSFLGIAFIGGPICYGFFFCMLFVLIVCAGYNFLVFYRFKIYQRAETNQMVAGSSIPFYLTLKNEDFYTFSGLQLEFFSDFSSISGWDDSVEYELLPHTGLEKETTLVCKYRGEYEVGVKAGFVQDFLRIFHFRFEMNETLRVTVFPRVEIFDTVSGLDVTQLSSKDSFVNPTEPDVLVRDYIPGDDIRNINWKLTAKSGKPVVRKRIGEDNTGISIIMDSCRYSKEQKDFLPLENKILETALALTYYYLDHGIGVGVYALERQPQRWMMKGTGSFEDFYQKMCKFTFSEESTADKLFTNTLHLPQIFESSAVIFIIHEWTEAARLQAVELEKYGVMVMVYCITDKADEWINNSLDGRMQVVTVGYEAKLKEVL